MSRPARNRKPVEVFVAGPSSSKPDATCFSSQVSKSAPLAHKVLTSPDERKSPAAKKPKVAEGPMDNCCGKPKPSTSGTALEENTNTKQTAEPAKRSKRTKTSAVKYFEIIFRRTYEQTNIGTFSEKEFKTALKENFDALGPNQRKQYEGMAINSTPPEEGEILNALGPNPPVYNEEMVQQFQDLWAAVAVSGSSKKRSGDRGGSAQTKKQKVAASPGQKRKPAAAKPVGASKAKRVSKALDCHDWVCAVCEKSGDLMLCEGECFRSFHLECSGLPKAPAKFLCERCVPGGKQKCDALDCKDESSEVVKCQVAGCGKHFHLECARNLPFVEFAADNDCVFTCPRHTCATCTKPVAYVDSVVCVRCPATYHNGCVPPGVEIVVEDHCVVCSKHHTGMKKTNRYNSDQCKLCNTGGDLMCCDGCPAAFHPACLEEELNDNDEQWLCPDCQAGRRVLEGDVVWAKMGVYRWWPALVCELDEIPDSVVRQKPAEIGAFPVRWLGAKTQYSWLDHACVMPLEDRKEKVKKGGKAAFNRALEEAHKLNALRQEEKLRSQSLIKEEMPSFDKVSKNRYTDGDKNAWDVEESHECNCSEDDKCGEYSQCSNREMYIECVDESCKWGKECQNRRIQGRQWSSLEPRKTLKCGWGLFAKTDVAEGTFLIEYQGEVISKDTMQERLAHCMAKGVRTYYYMTLDNRYSIDARTKACNARFINHACSPNAQTIVWQCAGEKRAGIFALRDIKADEEITYDYDFDYLDTTDGKCACYCGAPNCSGVIGVKKKMESSKPLIAGRKPVATTGLQLFRNEYCKNKKIAPAKGGEDKKAEDPEEKALRLAKNKQDREDAKVHWDAMDNKSKMVYELKAEETNKARLKVKIKRRKPKVFSKAASEDDCFLCHDGGELFICDVCPKAFHPGCLGLDAVPKGKWKCPAHACATCNKKPDVTCKSCAFSYCAAHSEAGMGSKDADICVECAAEAIEESAEEVGVVGIEASEVTK